MHIVIAHIAFSFYLHQCRNCLLDLPYSQLLQIPDEEKEFLTLDELTPHQLNELGNSPHQRNCGLNSEIRLKADLDASPFDARLQNISPGDQCDFDGQRASSSFKWDMTQSGQNSDITDRVTSSIDQPVSVNSDITSEDNLHHQLIDDLPVDSEPRQFSQVSHSRKRKNSYVDTSDLEDDTCDDAKSTKTSDENRKQNHSEIEKRRRDKMNTYITELSAMIPMCHAMSRKLDKLTVLRMAVQHLKTIRGAFNSYTEGHYKPAFLSDQELKMLILQAAEGFLFVVGCDRGRILYVSESVSQVLNCSQADLLGQSWFDILHPKDVAKVKEQLSSPDLCPRERLIDAKTMLPVRTDMPQEFPRLCPGARRSFFCRMKFKSPTSSQIKEESDTSSSSQSSNKRKSKISSDKKYRVIQCTGYLKSWSPVKIEEQESCDNYGDSCNISCLVAVGRIPPNLLNSNINRALENHPHIRQIQFFSRHAMDGKFLFVDQRATLVFGFLPQELLGTSMYEYYHHEDISLLAEAHKMALQSSEEVTTPVYRFRSKSNGFVRLQSDWKSFKNPWTKDIEYLIAKNSVFLVSSNSSSNNHQDGGMISKNFDFFSQSNGKDMQRMINCHVEASKIGRQIAEQVMDYQKRINGSSSENSPDPEENAANSVRNESTGHNALSENNIQSNGRETNRNPATNRATVNVQANNSINDENSNHCMTNNLSNGQPTASTSTIEVQDPSGQVTVSDGNNDEAAMAAIMSLLESDGGLGGSVDFATLPWPLP